NSQITRMLRVTLVDRFQALPEVIRSWDSSVPKLGRCQGQTLTWQAQQSLRALAIRSIHEHQSSVVGFSNLTAQWQTNSRAVGLCCKKRNEKIGRVHNARTFVFNKNLNATCFLAPTKRDVSMRFKRGINSVVHQIDQRLFNLRRVCAN